nr:MAG TPA: hypothetical protein [Caudoviricetes sp.]DAM72101.1 MAG TPA: hypothetical protein [Caudoviricetes sp.]DAQ21380.1 MAG TPA: hypothetical protein [Caudoviricetes sp.]
MESRDMEYSLIAIENTTFLFNFFLTIENISTIMFIG